MTIRNDSKAPHRDFSLPISGHPIHPVLVAVSAACFLGSFTTDIVYLQTLSVAWLSFSDWQITVGLISSVFAILAFAIDFASGRRIQAAGKIQFIGYPLALLLSLINAFVHSRDGYTAVVPFGLILSSAVVFILLLIWILPFFTASALEEDK